MPGSIAHLEVEELGAPARRRIVRLRDQYENALRSLVERGCRERLFVEADAALAVHAILGAANGTVQWYRPKGRMPLTHIAHTFATQLVRGLISSDVSFEAPNENLLDPSAALVESGAPQGGHA